MTEHEAKALKDYYKDREDKGGVRTVFVIMPFEQTSNPQRKKGHLTSFYELCIKAPLEKAVNPPDFRFEVCRSDDTFNITENIILQLYHSDIMIADLSGTEPNANVMYELGVRMAFTNKPVILIREKHVDNRLIFDVSGFHTELYDPMDTAPVTKYICEKARAFSSGKEKYESPILKALRPHLPLLEQISRHRAANLLMTLRESMSSLIRCFISSLLTFVFRKTGKILPFAREDVTEPTRFIDKNLTFLNSIEYSDFEFVPASQPALSHIIATNYLDGIVEPVVVALCHSMYMDYHNIFLSDFGWWRAMSSQKCLMFLLDTQMCQIMAQTLMDYIVEPEDNRRSALQDSIFQHLKQREKMWADVRKKPVEPNVSTNPSPSSNT